MAKNGSLDFACVLTCAVGARSNVPFVRWQIELKKCAVGKIKNTEGSVPIAFGIGLLVVRFLYSFYVCVHLPKWFTFFLVFSPLFLSGSLSFTFAPNVFRLAEGGAFTHYRSFGKPHFNYTKKLSTEALHPRLRQTDVSCSF